MGLTNYNADGDKKRPSAMWHQHPTGCISVAINDITDYYFKSAFSKFKQRGSQQNIHGYSQTDNSKDCAGAFALFQCDGLAKLFWPL